MNAREQPVCLESTIIAHPRAGTVYEISHPDYPNNKITVILSGTKLDQCKTVDVATMRYEKIDGASGIISYVKFTFLTKDHLPFYVPRNAFSRIMLLDHASARLCRINYLKMNFDSYDLEFRGPLAYTFELYETQMPKTSYSLGTCPVIYPTIRPSYQRLNALFSQFMQYNKNKLEHQYLLSDAYCHIRAHFINILLGQYHIESHKVYQLWHPEDWQPSHDQGRRWAFHCAAMIIDDENKQWVWDPWVASQSLMTINDWSALKNSPTPYKIMITNKAVVSDFNKGKVSYSSYQLDNVGFNTLQAVMDSAIPNPPEKPIPLQYPLLFFTFFNFKKRVLPSSREKNNAISNNTKIHIWPYSHILALPPVRGKLDFTPFSG